MQFFDKIKDITELVKDEYTGEVLYRNRWYPAYYIEQIAKDIELRKMARDDAINGMREDEKLQQEFNEETK